MEKILFELNEVEVESYKTWLKTHRCTIKDTEHAHREFSPCGGVVNFIITPTTLGNIVKAKCNACGAEIDLTDYKSM